MKDKELKTKQSRIMLAAQIRFTRKCLIANAINNSLLGYNLGFAADLLPTSKPICLNYSLN